MIRALAYASCPCVVVVGVLLTAGSSLLQAGGVRVLFDPNDRNVGPFPTDFLTVVDPRHATGLRVNLPLPPCEDEPSSCREVEAINRLDGFSPYPRTSIRFSEPVDLHTLGLGIHYVWLDSVTSGNTELHPSGHRTQINELVWDPGTHTAYFKPNEVLEQRRRLLLVVSQDVRDTQGDSVERDPAFEACVVAPATNYCDDLSEAVDSLDDPGRVVGAALFTTLSATEWLENARDQLVETRPQFRPLAQPNVVSLGGLRSITVQRETGAGNFVELVVPFPALSLPNLDRVALGEFQSPNYLGETQTIPDSTGMAPAALGTTTIPFHVLVPKAEPPATGYPVVVVSHGLGDNRLEGPTLIANGLAAEGFVTAVINSVGHGGGPNGVVRLEPVFGAPLEVSLGGRGVDLDADGTIEDDEGCIITKPVASGLRDCMRQTAVDLMQLVRVLRSGIDLEGDGGIPLDGDRIYFVGHSLGAPIGTLLLTVEPSIRVAALNAGGATAVNVIRRSETFRDIAVSFLAERQPPLLNKSSDFDDDYTRRNLPPHVITVPGALAIQTVFERAEWIQMPADSLAYAPYLSRAPLPGVAAKSILFQLARNDLTIRNTENSALVRAAAGRETTQVYLHDVARDAVEELAEDPHAYLVNEDLFGPGGRVAQATQAQIAAYFATEGEAVTDVNPLVSDLFETDVFEFPFVLPDHLGGDSELTAVSAASFTGPNLAVDSIATAFSPNLAQGTHAGDRRPLPTSLLESTVRIIDSAGTIHYGGFFFVSPMQSNFWIPPRVALGPAEIVGASGDGTISRGTTLVSQLAPALFTANASGEGAPAALLLRFRGSDQTAQQLVFDGSVPLGNREPLLLDFGLPDETVFLALFATGMRDGSEVRATIDGEAAPVSALMATEQFVGLDQLNVGPIPRSFIGRGVVELRVFVDGVPANVVLIRL